MSEHDEKHDEASPRECSICGSPIRNEYQEGRSYDTKHSTCRPCAYRLELRDGASDMVLFELIVTIADEIQSGDLAQGADLVAALIDCGEMIGAARERATSARLRRRPSGDSDGPGGSL